MWCGCCTCVWLLPCARVRVCAQIRLVTEISKAEVTALSEKLGFDPVKVTDWIKTKRRRYNLTHREVPRFLQTTEPQEPSRGASAAAVRA